MMTDLAEKRCLACEAGIKPLNKEQAQQYLAKLDGWQIDQTAQEIKKHFDFKNFTRTLGFVNAIAYLAINENHHPDITFGYNYCHVVLTTHAIKGLSENDFIMAAKIEKLVDLVK